MPDASASRVTLVSDPDVGLKVIELVVPDHVFRITHDLQDHHVSSMRKHKSLFLAERAVEPFVQANAVAAHKLVFREPVRHALKAVFFDESFQHLGLHPYKSPPDVRGLYVESFDVSVVTHMVEDLFFGYLKEGLDQVLFQSSQACGIQERHVEHVMRIKDFASDSQHLRVHAHRCYSAPFTVPAIVHPDRWLKDMLSGHRHIGREAGDAATALIRRLDVPTEVGRSKFSHAAGQYIFSKGSAGFHIPPHPTCCRMSSSGTSEL